MNDRQKICLWLGIAVIVLMGIFPPTQHGFYYRALYGGIRHENGKPPIVDHIFHPGYTFLFSAKASEISLNKLIIQWGIVGAVTGGLIYTFKDKKPKDGQAELKYPDG